MEYTVQYGDTLWAIAGRCLANPAQWPEIARLNQLRNPDVLLAGQLLQLPNGAKLPPAGERRTVERPQVAASPAAPMEQRPATAVPARAFFFVVADEVNPFSRKVVRKVLFPSDLRENPELLKRILNPERYGFRPRGPGSNVSIADHVQDIQTLRHKSLVIDREVLIEGPVPAAAVKGATAMALTRGLQVVQGVGIVVSAYDLGRAGVHSYPHGSVKPIAAESVRQVGGWASALAGLKLGAATEALFGVATRPAAVVTAGVDGLLGGAAGYFGFDWIADYIHEN